MPPVIDLGAVALPAAYTRFLLEELDCYRRARESKFSIEGKNAWNQYLLAYLEAGEQVASDVQVREAEVDYGKDHAGFFVRGKWTTLRKPRIDTGFCAQLAQRLSGIVEVSGCKQSHVLMSAVSVPIHTDKIDEFLELGVVVVQQADLLHGLRVGSHVERLQSGHAYLFNLCRPHALVYGDAHHRENLESPPAALLSVCFEITSPAPAAD